MRCTIYSDLQCSNGHTLPLIRDSQLPIRELMPVFEFLRNIGREKIELLFQVKIRALRHILFLSRGSKRTKIVLSVLKHFDTFLLRLLSRVRHGHHTNNNRIDHFLVPPGQFFKTRVGAQPLIWKSFFILMQIKLIFTRKFVHLASF